MAYKHGVYNTEQATSLTVPVQGIAGLQVIFGTAPIHLAKDPAAAVNTPKLVYSYKEAVEAVGYSDDFENFTLCQSISACFQVFNVAPIILVNVLDPNKAAHVTQNQAESCDVVDGVVLYDKKYVLLNTLAVKNGSATITARSISARCCANHAAGQPPKKAKICKVCSAIRRFPCCAASLSWA